MQPVQLASWSTSAARGREGLLPSRQPKPAGGRRRRVHLPDHGGRVPAVGEPEARGQARAPSMWGTRASHARPLPFFVNFFVHLYALANSAVLVCDMGMWDRVWLLVSDNLRPSAVP